MNDNVLEARDPYVERRLRALERAVAGLTVEVATLRAAATGEDVTSEQPVGVLEAGHRLFVARLKGGRA